MYAVLLKAADGRRGKNSFAYKGWDENLAREQVLEILEAQKGKVVSGLELAKQLGVTRSAVWKDIQALRAQGVDIRSIKKTGYCLQENSDILSAFRIRSSLQLDGQQIQLHLQKKVDSTNQRILCLALEGAPGWSVCAAEEQTAGRGHAGRAFRSPHGKGAYCSILLYPPQGVFGRELTMLAAVSVCDALSRYAGIEASVRGSDDILCGNKKLCGILCEALTECESGRIQFAALGFGINVYTPPSSPECDEQFETSLFACTGRYCNRSELIGSLISSLYAHFGLLFCREELEKRYQQLNQGSPA